MPKTYKIHPGIGIARVGNSADGFFVASEVPGGVPLELAPGGVETPLTSYKDATGALKRQGVRFRVFEYEVDQGGERLVRELTAADATISWSVQLANTKAAGNALVGEGELLFPKGAPRNPDVNRADLAITPVLPPIAGREQRSTPSTPGKFRGKHVFLGELRTDAAGRLVVLGGRGVSAAHPVQTPIHDFANNPNWHDDVADGPVDATITFPGQPPIRVQGGAWVIVAPPDFAPLVQGLATLYDVALSAFAERTWPPTAATSFTQDILPILRRAVSLRWSQKYAYWNSFPKDFATLAVAGAAADGARTTAYNRLLDIENSHRLHNFHFTRLQRHHLDEWRAGHFSADFGAPPAATLPPQDLERAALEPCVGGGFYPGIEAGHLLTTPQIWAEPFRLTRDAFQYEGAAVQPRAGYLTERMACPWQADFFDCAGAWWPAQRPDKVFQALPPATPHDWLAGIINHEDLVANFWKLGVLGAAGTAPDGMPAYLEKDRDAGLPT